MSFFVLFFIIHILVCALLLFMRVAGYFECEYVSIFIAFLVPVWGLIMLFYKYMSDKDKDREGEPIEIEQPGTVYDEDSAAYSVNKSIVMDQDEMKEKVVPLEEALVVNDTETKRELIVDVLYSDPTQYISQLHKAKENPDTEVVHYAATALAEIQKDYDLRFQEISQKRRLNPEDEELDNEYQKALESYISSGLLEGDGLKNQLIQYAELLEEKLKDDELKGRWSILNKKADIDLRLKDVKALDNDIDRMIKHWPDRESVFVYRMKSAMLKKDSALLTGVLEEMKEKNIFLSIELRNLVRFWKTENEV